MKASFHRVLASVALAGIALAGSRTALAELPELIPTHTFEPTAQEVAADDRIELGHGVAIDGNTAMAGAPSQGLTGMVAVFTRSPTGVWSRVQTLTPADGTPDFGLAVTLKGNTALVRAMDAVFVFRRTGGTWAQTAKLTGSGDISNFGLSDSIKYHNGRVTVGANFRDGTPSTVYIFTLNAAGQVVSQTQIHSGSPATGSNFGFYVDMDDDTIVVGVPGELGGGAVYVFQRTGNSWTQTQQIVRPEADPSTSFGRTVALNRNVLLVGDITAQREGPAAGGPATADGHTASGAVYVFRPESDGTYVYHTRLRPTPDEFFAYTNFGDHIVTEGDRAVISAYVPNSHGLSRDGAEFVYERNGNTAVARYVALVEGGDAIALSGNRLLVGSPYHFDEINMGFDSIGWADLFTLPPVGSP
jgi:hypothetical protein